ncbi:armadillo-type protein [Bisporella sp. PMI_857]|nr:armadillo-type protein [Bisporella sp. PMI_857]
MAFHYPESSQHKYTKSSMLRGFIHKRNQSAGATLSSTNDVFISTPAYGTPILPADHPHSRALGELQTQQNKGPKLPKKDKESAKRGSNQDGKVSLHKKTLSSISLKSLGKDSESTSKSKDKEGKPKKTKSSTNLATLLSRPKSSKSLRKQGIEDEEHSQKNKENQYPALSPTETDSRPPIYAQFSSEFFVKQPSGGKFLEDEIDLYTPQEYNRGKQRDFYYGLGNEPTLGKRSEESQRPKSTYLPSNFSLQDISRRVSGGSSKLSSEIVRRVSGSRRQSVERKSIEVSVPSEKSGPNRGQRVLAAVSGFGSKPKQQTSKADQILADEDVDKEFEAMLDRRNIAENQRGKMRSLALGMKKDFIKQDWAEIEAAKMGTHDVAKAKSKRPRSRTFTLSRSGSKERLEPTKKSKPEGTLGRHFRTKSSESVKEGSKSITASGAAVAQNIIAKAKGQTPDDFVSYLRKITKPELVEVGRLHKLRLLLRNETVAWTNEFIKQGGMDEIVGLLHRTMEVEWREEHEDALLHETLLCLKALATTALALQNLDKIQITLFPALLHMVFDEEKKGPSEFTTRNIISSILFTYLKTAPISERYQRAKILLSYLKDPEPSESQRPVGFVLEMRQPRPYRVWNKEVVNVTKEVFLDIPSQSERSLPSGITTSSGSTICWRCGMGCNKLPCFTSRYYQWYPACPQHAKTAIPLREQLKVSGWEKCMGITLRTCKGSFYGGVHAGLRCWVAAAADDDGWDTRDVRCAKKPVEAAPKIDMKLDFGREKRVTNNDDAWL